MGEDFVRVQQLVQFCDKIVLYDAPLYEYRINSNSMTHRFKKRYWLDYGIYFNIAFELFSKYFSTDLDMKKRFLDFKLLELYNLIVLACKDINNFKGDEINKFREFSFYSELYSYFETCKIKKLKMHFILKMFFKKRLGIIAVAGLLKRCFKGR